LICAGWLRHKSKQHWPCPLRCKQDAGRLVHELQVHQVELELQNQELRNALEQVEESRTKYSDLYDFAPVGYLTLDEKGTIKEANLTVTPQLGIDRSSLINTPFPEPGDKFDEISIRAFRRFLDGVGWRNIIKNLRGFSEIWIT
jgi:PAS domain-containing protein